MTSFFLAANYSLCCVALVVLRRREPDLPRPYQAWGYPWSVWLVAAGSVMFLAWNVGGRRAQRTRGSWTACDRSHRTRTFHSESYSVVTCARVAPPSAGARILDDKRNQRWSIPFQTRKYLALSATGRRFICSITSPAIILRSSCSCLVISRGFVSRIVSVPIGKPLGPRKGTPA